MLIKRVQGNINEQIKLSREETNNIVGGTMSLENLIGRMQKAGVTDFTAEGILDRASRRGNTEEIKDAEKTVEGEKRIKRKKQAIRKGIDPKSVN
jgi:hypothetical protein